MLLVGGVLVVSGIVLTRTVEHRLEEENRERADQTVAYAADRLEAGVAVDSVFSSTAGPGDVFMVLRLADGTVIASQQPGPFTIPLGATESAVAGSAGTTFTSAMAVPPPGAQIVTRVVDLREEESVLVGVSPLDEVQGECGHPGGTRCGGAPLSSCCWSGSSPGCSLGAPCVRSSTCAPPSRRFASTLEQRVDVHHPTTRSPGWRRP